MSCACYQAEIDNLKAELKRSEENREGWKLAYNKVIADNVKLFKDNEKLKKDLDLNKNIKADTEIAKLTRKVAELQARNDAQAQTITIAQGDWEKLQDMTECEVYGQACSKRVSDHFNSVWKKWQAAKDFSDDLVKANKQLHEQLSITLAERNKSMSDFKDSEFVIKNQNNTIKNLVAQNVDYAEAILIYKNVTRSNLVRIAILTEDNEKLRAGPSTQTLDNYSRRISDLEAIDSNLRDEIYNVREQLKRKDEQIDFWTKRYQDLFYGVKAVLDK